jgi:type I restriction enzyme S subunit
MNVTEWQRILLKDVVQPRKDKAIPSNHPELPYIGMEHVVRDIGLIETFGASAEYKSSAPRVSRGDVLYGRLRPYLNKVAISPCDAFASGEFIVLPPNSEIDGRFLQLRLLSQDFVEFAGTLDAGDRPRVSWGQISQFEILLPPIELQRKIVELLEDHFTRLKTVVADVKQASVRTAQFRSSYIDQYLKSVAGKEVPLREILEFVGGFAFKSSIWQPSGTPVVKIMNVKHREVNLEGCSFVSTEVAEESKRFEIKKGDLLFNMTGATLGAFGFYNLDVDARMNQRVGKFKPLQSSTISLEFLAYFLEAVSTQRAIQQLSKGAAQPNISPTDILSMRMNLPSFKEQESIVAQLDSVLSKVTQVEKLCKFTLSESNPLRRSLLQSAFTGQLSKEVLSV